MGRGKNVGVEQGGGNDVYIHLYTNPENKKKQNKKEMTSAVNKTVNKLISDRESCKKLHKKLRFADPVFITLGIYL